jgi:hypothetical protein
MSSENFQRTAIWFRIAPPAAGATFDFKISGFGGRGEWASQSNDGNETPCDRPRYRGKWRATADEDGQYSFAVAL